MNRNDKKIKIVACKIPQEIRELHTTASGHFVVFTKGGMLEAGEAFVPLEKASKKGRGVPPVGYLSIGRKKYYYCLYGLFNTASTYEDV